MTPLNQLESSYSVFDGLHFHNDSHPMVRTALAKYAPADKLVRIWYGDTETGRACSSQLAGYLGVSPGAVAVPVVRRSQTSALGTPIRTQDVIRIDLIGESQRGQVLAHTVYQHPDFMPGRWKVEEVTLPAYLAEEVAPSSPAPLSRPGRTQHSGSRAFQGN